MPDAIRPILVTCPLGLPPLLAGEIAALGLPAEQLAAGVLTRGTMADAMRLNLWTRTGHRVLVEHARLRTADPDALYRALRGLPWEEIIPADGTLRVDSSVRNDTVRDGRFANLRVKDAVVDRIQAERGRRPDSGPEGDGACLFLHWRDEAATIYLDTSGAPLSRRGYRKLPHAAPLQETLAAGIVLATGWDGGEAAGHFLAPMCGSGTLAIEAALLGLGRAPGLLRPDFAFRHLLGFDAAAYEDLRREARSAAKRLPVRIIATDIDPRAVAAARQNARTAGVEEHIEFAVCDFRAGEVPAGTGVCVLNPEYGARLGDAERLAPLYAGIGDFFKQRLAGWRGFVFTGNPDLAKRIGLKPRRRTPLFNARIECRLLEYELYAGTRRKPHGGPEEAH